MVIVHGGDLFGFLNDLSRQVQRVQMRLDSVGGDEPDLAAVHEEGQVEIGGSVTAVAAYGVSESSVESGYDLSRDAVFEHVEGDVFVYAVSVEF